MHTDQPGPSSQSGWTSQGSLGREERSSREEAVDRGWKLEPTVPCTHFLLGENSESYQAASPSGGRARTCDLSTGHCLPAEVSTACRAHPGLGSRA